ncbi:MAG: Hsp20/alpha crystallin family protein [Alistipes sp.]|nr:Hsp20/alpha crystallin family protein [Alistipes sp.]
MMPVKKLNRLPGVFGDLFYDQWPEVFPKRGATPPINVIETDKKFKVEIAAPGMTKDDFKIELNGDNQLIVCLEKCMEKDENGNDKMCCGDEDCSPDEKHHYLRREFAYTSFRQIFNLPDSVDRDHIKAKMKHGILRIKLPKREGGAKDEGVKLIEVE